MAANRRRRARRQPAARPPSTGIDPRLGASKILAIDGVPEPDDSYAIIVSPVTLDDDRTLHWHPPQPVVFSLVEAARLCERAVPRRRRIVGNLKRRPNGAYEPQNDRGALDAVSDLWSAVLHSFAAIEAIANDSIDRLPTDSVVTIGKRDNTREIAQPEMVRRLNLDEKLKQAVPMLDLPGGIVGRAIAGTRPWEQYLHLKGLRDDLVHVKERGYDPDPDTRTAFDRLLLGDADVCARDAFEIVQAVRPGFLDERALARLSRTVQAATSRCR